MFASVLAGPAFGASHEEVVPELAHANGILCGIEQALDGLATFVGGGRAGECFGLLRRWDASGEVEGSASEPSGIGEGGRGFEGAAHPALLEEGIDCGWDVIEVTGLSGYSDGVDWSGRRLRQVRDPLSDCFSFEGWKLLFGRHVWVAAFGEHGEERACLGVAGFHDGTGISAFEECGEVIEFEAGFLFDGAVTLYAVSVEEGLDAGVPRGASVRRAGGEREEDERSEGNQKGGAGAGVGHRGRIPHLPKQC